ncbi:MAG: ketopantoate reductase family protein, partial [Lachnospiraceae bacterium]|nr:ketopantoate reductase family protein [Lachnospiraceae bacterium]
MKKIRRTAIVGMGALGLLYGEQIMDAFGYEAVSFLMDEERFKRHKEDVYTINGKVMHFNVTRVSEAEP